LQAIELPVSLYESIKEQNPVKAHRLIKTLEPNVLHILSELIMSLTAGNLQLENKLSLLIIQDLGILSLQTDNTFINKVLLPLFKNERKLPVTLTHKAENH
jgi:hypothetical protein